MGLVISDTHPHAVKEVSNLVDVNQVRQGEAGYSNECVKIRDLFISIDSQNVQNTLFEDLHRLLKGAPREEHSVVDLTLARKYTVVLYHVRVLCHSFLEYEMTAQ